MIFVGAGCILGGDGIYHDLRSAVQRGADYDFGAGIFRGLLTNLIPSRSISGKGSTERL